MPVHHHHPQRSRTDEPAVLNALATGVHDAFSHLTADDPAHLLRVVSSPGTGDVELGLLALDAGTHPADAMSGFTAPADWSAVGVVTAGSSTEWVEPLRAGEHSAPRAIRLTFLLGRSGASATLLTPIGAPDTERRTLCEPPIGVVADACRRVLGRPTAGPSEGPELWLSTRWLDRMLASAIGQPGAVSTWELAVRLHPLVREGPPPPPSALTALLDRAASEYDWERLRLLATQGGGESAVTPEVAAWMDAGFFARHLLAAELPIDLLVSELEALVPPVVMSAVRQALPEACGRLL